MHKLIRNFRLGQSEAASWFQKSTRWFVPHYTPEKRPHDGRPPMKINAHITVYHALWLNISIKRQQTWIIFLKHSVHQILQRTGMKDPTWKSKYSTCPPTRSHRVLWAINKIGLEDCTTAHAIRLYAGEHKRDEVKELNPLMQIPVVILTDGEGRKRTMTQSCAIATALSELCDDRLSPPRTDVLSRATYHRVNAICAANLDFMVTAVMWNEKVAPEEMRNTKVATKGPADFKSKGAVVVKQILGDNQYIWGPDHDEFTVADISLA